MKMKITMLCLLVAGLTNGFAQVKKTAAPKGKAPVAVKKTVATPPANTSNEGIFAEIDTDKGKIVIQLEYKKTPITVANFISLAEGTNASVTDEKLKGKPFYDGLKFHRVITLGNGDQQDFMVQGGDPAGNGSGGPGYAFKDEFTDAGFDKPGILAMANSGPKTNGSQFFITVAPTSWLNQKHTIFGYVTKGMDVVNKIKQNDVMKKVSIIRKGAEAQKFNAAKVFADYMNNKAADEAKEAAIVAENKRKQEELEKQKKEQYNATYGPVMKAKGTALAETKLSATETATGLKYKVLQTGNGKKPAEGATVYIHYAGYLEDGSLFDSSYETVSKEFGKFDENRAKQNGYQPFPFQYGRKDGLIPGFLEGLNLMNFGDKYLIYIPSKLGYGERGAGNVIPPNSNIIFEIELFESIPTK
ncbi:MAG: peptidylprolyl isomerase [Flavobacterium sp.]|nr:MAG: peptidylprolyl isomerase [Flavobacterium sp.] [Flavobacterium sp. FEMGT703F]